jgi:nucleoside 2-deoxyribosyltransferase
MRHPTARNEEGGADMAEDKNIRVYCSGPMFSPGDLWEMENIAKTLEKAGYTTYLPQRDGIEVGKVMGLMKDHPVIAALGTGVFAGVMQTVRKAIYAWDMYNVIERCQALAFNMNGRVPDGGSIVETASAYTAGKPIVIYKNTTVSAFGGWDNPMISGLCYTWKYVDKVSDIPKAIEEIMKKIEPSPYTEDNIPPRVKAVLAVGKEVGHLLEILKGKHPDLWQLFKALAKDVEHRDVFKEAFPK